MKMLIHLLLLLITLLSTLAEENPVVETLLGQVQGYYKKSYDNKKYAAFEGIPYAKPPVGNLRFSEPVEPEPWRDTLIANTTCACIQYNMIPGFIIPGVEDCLYLNVYVPKEKPSPDDMLDVIVHIHGGGFMAGTATLAGPKFLIDRNVVYVNINYRLGPFGYLSTEDDIVPGNNGQKDQVLALKWIQKHIKQFGGNPNSVTITGVSAGGAAVHFHYFSKLSRGLFHRGISHSGTAFASWAIQENALGKTKQLAATLGCLSENNRELIECLRDRPADEILNNLKHLKYDYGFSPLVIFGPVIEKPSMGAFIDDHPLNLLQNKNFNDLPWISSITDHEGSLGLIVLSKDIENVDENWNDNAHHLLDYTYTACDSDKSQIAQKIKKQYFGAKKITMNNLQSILKMFGDRYFVHSFQRSAQIQGKVSKSNVFAYMNSYKNSLIKVARQAVKMDTNLDYGVGHGEDAVLTYSVDFSIIGMNQPQFDNTDILIKNFILDVIISFIKTDIPKIGNIQLQPVDSLENFAYLNIQDPDNIDIKVVKELSPIEFWDSLPLNENEKYLKIKCDDNSNSSLKLEL